MPSKEEVKGILDRHKHLNFVQRVLKPEGQQTIKNPDGSESSHSMSSGDGYVLPTVIKDKRNNRLYRLSGKAAGKYAAQTGERIKFKTDKEALEFSKDYKKVWDK